MTEAIRKNFASDNIAPVCPEVMAALARVNEGSAASYGEDSETSALAVRMADLFECRTWVFPVATGTAANSLALSAATAPFGAVICDQSAHINNDEAGAPEFFMHGARLMPLPSPDGRMDPGALDTALTLNAGGGVHTSPVQTLSLTQSTEWGTVYSLDQLDALTGRARAVGLTTHLDGARLGNAIAALGCSPAEATWKAGFDMVSLGGTKNGAMAAEAVLIFEEDLAQNFLRRIKRSGHLWSKQRYLSAQLMALFEDGLWLRHAVQANLMAQRLAHGLRRHPAASLPFDVQSNEVFVVLPERSVAALEALGFGFYRWTTPPGVDGVLIRLVTCWATEARDVDNLLDAL
ncbi:threonine aldolase family protein [Asaia krungthepensis]|uniref:L-threonine aldolase n=1 Tax=Asaia krungthepensis NRIC 0535 TaxID=1307925 RepID=A0ABQ0Q0C3_9PROT|nr:beta-eliminating lyase-related protein [Asaia krungthepensis]GBQ86032.1 low-specificity threonine aldolase [Asaia krungthepensis NRIC 0535]